MTFEKPVWTKSPIVVNATLADPLTMSLETPLTIVNDTDPSASRGVTVVDSDQPLVTPTVRYTANPVTVPRGSRKRTIRSARRIQHKCTYGSVGINRHSSSVPSIEYTFNEAQTTMSYGSLDFLKAVAQAIVDNATFPAVLQRIFTETFFVDHSSKRTPWVVRATIDHHWVVRTVSIAIIELENTKVTLLEIERRFPTEEIATIALLGSISGSELRDIVNACGRGRGQLHPDELRSPVSFECLSVRHPVRIASDRTLVHAKAIVGRLQVLVFETKVDLTDANDNAARIVRSIASA